MQSRAFTIPQRPWHGVRYRLRPAASLRDISGRWLHRNEASFGHQPHRVQAHPYGVPLPPAERTSGWVLVSYDDALINYAGSYRGLCRLATPCEICGGGVKDGTRKCLAGHHQLHDGELRALASFVIYTLCRCLHMHV